MPAPLQSVRMSIAIDDAHRDEPLTVELSENSDPIEVERVIIERLISPQPAFAAAGIPVEINLFGLDEPLCQRPARRLSELDFEAVDQRFQHPV